MYVAPKAGAHDFAEAWPRLDDALTAAWAALGGPLRTMPRVPRKEFVHAGDPQQARRRAPEGRRRPHGRGARGALVRRARRHAGAYDGEGHEGPSGARHPDACHPAYRPAAGAADVRLEPRRRCDAGDARDDRRRGARQASPSGAQAPSGAASPRAARASQRAEASSQAPARQAPGERRAVTAAAGDVRDGAFAPDAEAAAQAAAAAAAAARAAAAAAAAARAGGAAAAAA